MEWIVSLEVSLFTEKLPMVAAVGGVFQYVFLLAIVYFLSEVLLTVGVIFSECK